MNTPEHEDEVTLENARALADEVEVMFDGKPTSECIYAIGMLIASAIAHAKHRDRDATMSILGRVVDLEIKEIDARHRGAGLA